MNASYILAGLEGMLFQMLDREVDIKLTANIKDTLNHIVQTPAQKLGFWLSLCKSVLAASSGTSKLTYECCKLYSGLSPVTISLVTFLVAGVQLYNRHFVSVCLSFCPGRFLGIGKG